MGVSDGREAPGGGFGGAGRASGKGCSETSDEVGSGSDDVFPAEMHELDTSITEALVTAVAPAHPLPPLLRTVGLVLRQPIGFSHCPELRPPEVDPFGHPAESVEELCLEHRRGQPRRGEHRPRYGLQCGLRSRVAQVDRNRARRIPGQRCCRSATAISSSWVAVPVRRASSTVTIASRRGNSLARSTTVLAMPVTGSQTWRDTSTAVTAARRTTMSGRR